MLAVTILAAMAPGYAIAHVSVLDMDSGRWAKDQTVVVRGGKIESVAAKARVPAGATVIDGRGKFLIPGLWDAHIHWYDQRFLSLFTANGVTSARVMFGAPMHKTWRDSIAAGSLIGPNLEIGGPIVDGPKPVWPGSIACGTAEEGRVAVKKVKDDKYDFVKVYSLLPRDAYMAIAEASKNSGIRFEGHVPSAISVQEASDAGQRTIEHLTGMLTECASTKQALPPLGTDATPLERLRRWRQTTRNSLDSFSPEAAKAMAATLKKNGTMVCPTLTVLRAIANLNDPEMAKDKRIAYLPSFVVNSWNPKSDFRFKDWGPDDWKLSAQRFLVESKIVTVLAKEGVKLLAGTDCLNPYCMPGFSLHDELALLVAAGVSPLDAIRAATIRPAELIGKKTGGRIRAGEAADLVLLREDPLKAIKATRSIEGVMQTGNWHDRKALNVMLADAKKLAKASYGAAGSPGYLPCDHLH